MPQLTTVNHAYGNLLDAEIWMDHEHWQEPHCRNYGNKVKERANK